jgi:murein DD-endopeptidase MepM/ murein hydrolase activator NlpD
MICGCGTFRSGSGGYRGIGQYKTPGDYAHQTPMESQESLSDDEVVASRRELNRSANYTPRGPFQLRWPVKQVHFNRGFHPANDPKHAGIDFGGKRGTLILAAHEGVVIYEGHDFHGYGNMMIVEYNDEWATLYAHLDNFLVDEGMVVGGGTPIGAMGATGHATGVHLHFELMHAHQPVDPLPYLTQNATYTKTPDRRKRRAER